MSGTTTYEAIDDRLAAEAIMTDHSQGLEIVDGHAVKAPGDYESPDRLYDILIARIRKYHPSTDVTMIKKAYDLAQEAHGDQCRKSGEPYIIHPLWVAIILADLEMDKETIAAGILHDVVEDTQISEEEIRRDFGDDVALLVDGVTKLGRLSYSSDKLDVQAENLRKMFLAMAKDIRVIIIKLADRLHNLRTLQFMKPAKQKEKAKETMDIYAPIAQRLGISKIKTELDDLALKYFQPEVFLIWWNRSIPGRWSGKSSCSRLWRKSLRIWYMRTSRRRSAAGSSIFSAFTRRWSTRIRRWIRSMTFSLSALLWIP